MQHKRRCADCETLMPDTDGAMWHDEFGLYGEHDQYVWLCEECKLYLGNMDAFIEKAEADTKDTPTPDFVKAILDEAFGMALSIKKALTKHVDD